MSIPLAGFNSFVGIIGSGQIGEDPFDRRSWSGSSYFFFRECQRQGLLSRAIGVELPALTRARLIALNFSPNRRRWQTAYYMDPRYRRALTREVAARLSQGDFEHSFLQIGAMYDVPGLVGRRAPCFSYHDGNMAYSRQSPYAVQGLPPIAVKRGLAYERQVYDGLTMIFTMSEHLRQSFINDFDVPPERVVAIGAGINLEQLPDATLGKRYDRKEILFVGVEFERKGGWHLLEAFRNLRMRAPDAALHIVGPRALKIPAELHQGVHYHGYLNKAVPTELEKLKGLFRDASLFVMPSLYEPFGIAPLEAMAYGLPCLVTNGWGLRETVRDGVTGGLVESGNVDDLTEKLCTFLGDPVRLQAMGERGREKAIESTWEKVVSRLKSRIEKIVRPDGNGMAVTRSFGV